MSAANPAVSGSFSTPRVLADYIPGARVRDVLLVVGGAVLTGLAAQISFTIAQLSPVPYTMQTFAVLLVGASFGLVRAALSIGLYVAAGLAGVPWFADTSAGLTWGSGGPTWDQTLNATLGYLIGFVVAAALLGWLSQRGNDRVIMSSITEMFLATLVIFAIGVPVLMAELNIGLAKGLEFGVYPFVVTDTLKLLAAAGLLPLAWRIAGKSSRR